MEHKSFQLNGKRGGVDFSWHPTAAPPPIPQGSHKWLGPAWSEGKKKKAAVASQAVIQRRGDFSAPLLWISPGFYFISLSLSSEGLPLLCRGIMFWQVFPALPFPVFFSFHSRSSHYSPPLLLYFCWLSLSVCCFHQYSCPTTFTSSSPPVLPLSISPSFSSPPPLHNLSLLLVFSLPFFSSSSLSPSLTYPLILFPSFSPLPLPLPPLSYPSSSQLIFVFPHILFFPLSLLFLSIYSWC